MVTFGLDTVITWLYNLFVYQVFGDAILACMFGFVLLIVISIKIGLGADSLIVLGVFSSVMFTHYIFQIDLSIVFILAISIGIVAMAILRLMRR